VNPTPIPGVELDVAAPIRILLVEDNDVFRSALELLLGIQEGFQVVGAVDDGRHAAPACRELEPDVVVMDYLLPGLDGVQATAAVREVCPKAKVVCLTASADTLEVSALQAAGAVACLRKDQALDEIVGAIRHAAATNGATS
jgi:DNA-binding NarL/FixJ family response regulator